MTTIVEKDKKVHLALYRKYRPTDFNNLVGQSHVQKALSNAISQGQPSHAYVFTGPRGTGKTSSALLFGKALNCQSPVNGGACGQCAPCQNPEDILERDAATYNSVDSIRELNSTVGYAPMYGKYKIIILDEAHMLTTGAFNALLKTLEEPPAHVIFILASTEVHKIPATILSRCQRFDFKRISNQEIASRLAFIANNEGIQVDEKSLQLIAQFSVGGLRDAIGLLDQSASMTPEKVVTIDTVLDLTGSIDVMVTGELIRDVLSGSIEQALSTFAKAFESKEPKFFIEEMLIYIRDVLMYKKIGANAPLKKAYMDKNFELVVNALSTEKAYDLLSELQKATGEISYTHDVNLFVELLIIKLITNDRDKSLQAQIDELRALITNGALTVDNSVKTGQNDGLEQIEDNQEYVVADPIAFIKEAEEAQANGIDWTSIPLETPAHELAELNGLTDNPGGNENSIPAFEAPADTDNSIPAFEAPADTDNSIPAFEAPVDTDNSIPAFEAPADTDNSIPTFDSTMENNQLITSATDHPALLQEDGLSQLSDTIILSDKQKEVLTVLETAHSTHRANFETKQDSIAEGLKSSISTLAIYREFTIKAVNEGTIVMTHNEKAKVKLINVVKNRSLIEGVIEDHFQTMRILPLTHAEWLEVVAVYKDKNNIK